MLFGSAQINSQFANLLSQSHCAPYRSLMFCLSSELQKYRRYEIVMTAYNVIGESPPSAPVEVFVGEAGKRLCENKALYTNHAIYIRPLLG